MEQRRKSFSTKTISVLIGLLLIIPSSFAFKVENAYATGLPVIDAANLVSNTATAASTGTHTLIVKALDGLAWTVAKVAVQSITRSVVNWINSGFKGSPAFVTDLQNNLQNVGDSIVDSFLDQVNASVVDATGFNIRSPFQDQVSSKLRDEYYRQSANYGIPAYSLGQSSQNPTVFLNGNFSQGGFNAFLSASQNPQNNPFGAYLLAQNALFSQVNSTVEQRKTELSWGKGFLSFRSNCGGSAVTRGSSLTASGLPDAKKGGTLEGSKNQVLGGDGYARSANAGNILTDNRPTNVSLSATPSTVSLSQKDSCVGKKIQSPGAVIENQLENSLGSGVRQLELADSINEIVGALAGQLVNQVVGGATGLLGASSPSAGGGPSAVNQATDSSQYNAVTSSIANGFKQDVSNQRTSVVMYQNNEQSILNVATAAQQTCGVAGAGQYPEIQAAVSSATAGVTKASSALNAIDSLTANVNTAQNAPIASRTTAITAVVTQNQNLLSSNIMPSPQEIAQATLDSQDSGTSTPQSLYTKLQSDATACSSGLRYRGL